jgi:hypothetical protein
MRPFRWLATLLLDRWLLFTAWLTPRRDTIGQLIAQVEQERERHRREIEAKDDTIARQAEQIKGLLDVNQVLRAECAANIAVLTRVQAEAEYAIRRQAGGAAP